MSQGDSGQTTRHRRQQRVPPKGREGQGRGNVGVSASCSPNDLFSGPSSQFPCFPLKNLPCINVKRPSRVPLACAGPRVAFPLRSDIYEEASVKTGARPLRDFPDIYSASSAMAEHQETLCGRSHSIPRRRDAPRRTSGCDLSPALDLDLDSLLPVVPVCPGPKSHLRHAKPIDH
jgi:hypothetical protein